MRYSLKTSVYLIVFRMDVYLKTSFKTEVRQGLLSLQLFAFKTGRCALLTDKWAESMPETTGCRLLGDPEYFLPNGPLRKHVMEKMSVLIGRGVVHRTGNWSYVSPKLAGFSSIAY